MRGEVFSPPRWCFQSRRSGHQCGLGLHLAGAHTEGEAEALRYRLALYQQHEIAQGRLQPRAWSRDVYGRGHRGPSINNTKPHGHICDGTGHARADARSPRSRNWLRPGACRGSARPGHPSQIAGTTSTHPRAKAGDHQQHEIKQQLRRRFCPMAPSTRVTPSLGMRSANG
jgi:hypothetical protein